jgi:long-chain acyl-CoA synthetase
MDAEKLAENNVVAADYSKELMKVVNAQMPAYSKLSAVEAVEAPFEKTPKMSIKRFLYS